MKGMGINSRLRWGVFSLCCSFVGIRRRGDMAGSIFFSRRDCGFRETG